MSTNSSRKCKNAIQKETEKSESNATEVFVMPPNLLEKLGINLGSIYNSTQPQIVDELKQDHARNVILNMDANTWDNKNKTRDNISILETANLMKKSVFLSPTFIATDSNVISGEVEIAMPDHKGVVTTLQQSHENSMLILENSKESENKIHAIKQCTSKNLAIKVGHHDQNVEVTDTMPSIFSNNDDLSEVAEQIIPQTCLNFSKAETIDIHFHDRSENFSDDSNLSSTSTSTAIPGNNEPKKKVFIISEEIVDTEQLKTLFSPSKTMLTPIPMNTLIVNTTESSDVEVTDKTKKYSPKYLIDTDLATLHKNEESSFEYDLCKHLLPVNDELEKAFKTEPSSTAPHRVNDESSASHSNENMIDNVRLELDNARIMVICNNITSSSDCNHLSLNNGHYSKDSQNQNIHICDVVNENCNPNNNNDFKNITEVGDKLLMDKNKCVDTNKNVDNDHIKLRVDTMAENVSSNLTPSKTSSHHHSDIDSISLQNNEIDLNKNEEKYKNIPIDKVSEIATHLSKYFKTGNKKLLNMRKNNFRESDTKLSIQGVEKPGGIKSTYKLNLQYKNIHTYERKSRIKQLVPLTMPTDEIKTLHTLKITNDFEEELNVKSCAIICKTRAFCVCYDFGQLGFYDEDNLYEHIHFCNQKNVDCNLEVIFGIYHENEDNCSVHNITEANNQNYDDVDTSDLDFNFCWNEISEKEEIFMGMNMLIPYTTESKEHVNEINSNVDYILSSEEDGDKDNNEEVNQNDCNSPQEHTSKESNEMEKAHILEQSKQLDNVGEDDLELRLDLSAKHTTVPKQPKEEEIVKVNNNKVSDLEQEQYLVSSEKEELESVASRGVTADISKQLEWHGEKENVTLNTSTPEKSCRKRRLSLQSRKQDNEKHTTQKKTVKCDVCHKMLHEAEWEEHISSEHCYIAWPDGATIDLDTYLEDESLLKKLNDKLAKEDTLVCTFCQLRLKKASRFILHIKKCYSGRNDASKSDMSEKDTAKCGVCTQDVEVGSWVAHIANTHNYLAWKDGEPPLDLSNDDLVWEHLNGMSKDIGGLVCSKCGLVRKYVKQFLAHIKTCKDNQEDSMASVNTTLNVSSTVEDISIYENNLRVTPSRKCRRYSSKTQENYNIMESNSKLLNESDISAVDTSIDESKSFTNIVDQQCVYKCGVCSQQVDSAEWMDHIQKKHNYMAWKEGEPSLDLSSDDLVWEHLNGISKDLGGLVCSKCGLVRKYVKQFLAHIKTCKGSKEYSVASVNTTLNVSSTMENNSNSENRWRVTPSRKRRIYSSKTQENSNIMESDSKLLNESADISAIDTSIDESKSFTNIVDQQCVYKCGVCSQQVDSAEWMDHIQKKHNYMAWKEGEPSLDLDDEDEIRRHLLKVVNVIGCLICPNCGNTKKKPKVYLKHLNACEQSLAESKECVADNIAITHTSNADVCQCALCLKKMDVKSWDNHVMSKHYNIAWMVGEEPLDLNNPYMADKQLKEYKKAYGKLVCNICNVSKASNLGFYAHVLVCGKTEEEADQFKSLCDVCNKRYMQIYEYQHMRAHRDAEIVRENKMLNKQSKNVLKDTYVDHVEVYDSKRNRKAAEKAKSVIEKYKANNNICDKCESSAQCKCARKKREALSDSDASAQFESSDSESGHSSDIEVDEHLSDEEEKKDKRKRKHLETCLLKTQRIPFRINDENTYLDQSYKDFCNRHLSDDMLFEEWHNFEYDVLPDNELEMYMPPLKESCQIQFGSNDWLTIARFEAKKKAGVGIFVGGTAPRVRWAPPRLDDGRGLSGHWLAVAAHLREDQPRYTFDELPQHPALVQIWDAGDFNTVLPKIELGLALNHGAVWAMDWCPSGARDSTQESTNNENCAEPLRLGLLAVACSDGNVYIYPIPYPSTIVKSDNMFIKLKPVAELRLTEGEHRKRYQATSVCWSTQKGHSLILVGYSDGTVAFYDLNTNSPLLKTSEGKTTVLYPYHDERFQNSSVTGLGVYPAGDGAREAGAWAVGAVGAATLHVGAAQRRARTTHAAVVTNDIAFTPHWPAALLSGDEALVASVVNELEAWGQGRRVGCVCAIATCQRCASVACFTPPFVRTIVTHPINKEIYKKISTAITLTPIGTKMKEKKPKDELTVKLEPHTYDEVVTKYGITIRSQNSIKKKPDKNALASASKDIRADRYPLADVTSLGFCTTGAFHDRLAVATHSGLVFFIKV